MKITQDTLLFTRGGSKRQKTKAFLLLKSEGDFKRTQKEFITSWIHLEENEDERKK